MEQTSINQGQDTNRERFRQVLEVEIEKATTADYYIGVCMLTFDNQPKTGDTYSPLLEELSWVIGEEAQMSDLVVPYSYMNLALIVRKIMPVDVEIGARRICEAVAKRRFEVNGAEVRTTLSIGVACFPYNGVTADEVVAKTETAMLSAIELGGNSVVAAQ